MITLIGPPWPSKRLLQEKLAALPLEGRLEISWGVERPHTLNGQQRLDAVEQLEAFATAGLQHPEFTTSLPLAVEWVRGGALVFGRRRLHTHGRDIVGPTHQAWRRREYWVKVVDAIDAEWRIHVVQGRCIARGLKVQVEAPWRKMPVRNRGNGWRMRHDIDPPKGLRTLARQAVQAVGYDFGAVDLYLTTSGEQGVFEVNKAPGLDDYTASAYAGAFERTARDENVQQGFGVFRFDGR